MQIFLLSWNWKTMCHTPLLWKMWNWFKGAVASIFACMGTARDQYICCHEHIFTYMGTARMKCYKWSQDGLKESSLVPNKPNGLIGSLFARVAITKCRYSPRSLFPRVAITQCRYSLGSLFLRVAVTQVRHSPAGSLFLRVVIPRSSEWIIVKLSPTFRHTTSQHSNADFK